MSKEIKADLSLLIVTVFWGTSFPIMSIALKKIPPYSYISIRNIVAALLLAIVFHKRFRYINRQTLKAACLIGISLLIGSIFQVVGLLYTTPSKSGFITGLNVAVVPIIMALMYKKLPDRKTIAGILFSVGGLGVMSVNGRAGINFGDFLTLLGAIVFAVQIIFVDKYAKGADIGLLTTLELFVIGILGFIPAVGLEGLHLELDTFGIAAILYTAVFCTGIAMVVQNKMQPYTNPAHAAVIYLGEPVFSAIFSTFIGDHLTQRTLIGGGLILLGMLVVSLKFDTNKTKVQEEFV